MKKILLSLVAAAASAAMPALATEFSYEGLTYSVSDYTHATVVGCADVDATTITIPYTVNYPINGVQYMFFVTAVAPDALADSKMTTLIFAAKPYPGASSQGALTIDAGAFATSTLLHVVINRIDLPVVNGDPFSAQTYADGELTFGSAIDNSVMQSYLAVAPWSNFSKKPTTAVDVTVADTADEAAEYYTVTGMKVSDPQPGTLYIVRTGRSVTKRVM